MHAESLVPDLNRPTLAPEQIQDLTSSAPHLEHLSLDLDRNGSWPFSTLAALASIATLTSLRISFEAGLNLHTVSYGCGRWGLPRPSIADIESNVTLAVRLPEVSVDAATGLAAWLGDRKAGRALQRVEVVEGDFKEGGYRGPWDGRRWEGWRYTCLPGVGEGERGQGSWKCEREGDYDWEGPDDEELTEEEEEVKIKGEL